MQTIILYVITVVLFLGLDAIGLTRLVRPVFEENIGHLLLDDFRLVPAALFYMAFVVDVAWGTVLTGVSAWGGVVLTRWISTALA